MSHNGLEDVPALLRMEDIPSKDKVIALLDVLFMIDGSIDRLWEEICLDAILLQDKRDVGLLIAKDGIDSWDVLFAERDVHKAVEEPQCHFGRFLRRLGIVFQFASPMPERVGQQHISVHQEDEIGLKLLKCQFSFQVEQFLHPKFVATELVAQFVGDVVRMHRIVVGQHPCLIPQSTKGPFNAVVEIMEIGSYDQCSGHT